VSHAAGAEAAGDFVGAETRADSQRHEGGTSRDDTASGLCKRRAARETANKPKGRRLFGSDAQDASIAYPMCYAAPSQDAAMRQVVIPKYGPPDVFETREAPDPSPGEGDVRIRVRAAGVNFADVLARLGLYPDAPKPPVVVGYEVAGHVDAVGRAVTGLSEGDRVV